MEGLLIIGGIILAVVFIPTIIIRDGIRQRRLEQKRRHEEMVATLRYNRDGQPPPAPDIRGR